MIITTEKELDPSQMNALVKIHNTPTKDTQILFFKVAIPLGWVYYCS